MSPFEIVYGFNPLTPLDLLPLPVNERASLDGQRKAEVVKKLHESVRKQIEMKNDKYAAKANKGRRKVIFQPGEWVWVHMRKERFPTRRQSKLQPRGDGPFQVLERVNDNAYKLDLPGEYKLVLHSMLLIFPLLMQVQIRGRMLSRRGGMMRITGAQTQTKVDNLFKILQSYQVGQLQGPNLKRFKKDLLG